MCPPPARPCPPDFPAAGFFGFVLWAEVSARLYRGGRYRHMAHFTLLLVLFSAAAYKSEVRAGHARRAWLGAAAGIL